MSYSQENIGDYIMKLVAMGFELEDAQLAVQRGKLQLEDAVEWIVNGKPQEKNVLHLNQPFTSASTYAFETAGEHKPINEPQQSEESPLVSRLNRTEKEFTERANFEKKQLDETRRKIILEKKAANEAHKRILDEIKDDREKKKFSKNNQQIKESPGKKSGSGSEQSECFLQIRLPEGKAIKSKFNKTDTLQTVWNFISTNVANSNGMQLMQPFPPKIYADEHLSMTLTELLLVPTGSLVLSKTEKMNQCEEDTSKKSPKIEFHDAWDATVHEEESMESTEDMPFPQPAPHLSQPWVSGDDLHNWGQGHSIAATSNENQEEESDDYEFSNEVNYFDEGIENDNPYEDHQDDLMDVDDGEIEFPAVDPREAAANAAMQRFNISKPDDIPVNVVLKLIPEQDVPKLKDILLSLFCQRIADSGYQLYGFHCLPSESAEKIIELLMKHRKLNPKTLQIFTPCQLETVCFDYYPYTTNELLNCLKYHLRISHISLKYCSLITDKGLAILRGFKSLKWLNVAGCKQLTDKIVLILQDIETLENINLEGTSISDEGIRLLCQRKYPKLKFISLKRTDITDKSILYLSELPNLISLSLENTKVQSVDHIQEFSSLQCLNLSATYINCDSLQKVAKLKNLKALNLSSTTCISDGDKALESIKELKLRDLKLPDRTSITDAGLHFLTGMPLQTLDLSFCHNVGDAGILQISKKRSLKKLLLKNTLITDEGMSYICQLSNLEILCIDKSNVSENGFVSEALPFLQELSLAETGITNKFLEDGVLNSFKSLTKVNLSYTNISSKGAQCISLPLLKLLNLDGTLIRPELEGVIHDNCPSLIKVSMAEIASMSILDEQSY